MKTQPPQTTTNKTLAFKPVRKKCKQQTEGQSFSDILKECGKILDGYEKK